jgi:uncharacterized protein (DUF488 family)
MSHPAPAQAIYTIGHSTHPIDTFIGLLKAYDIKTLVDIRTIPGSRHNPQFSQKPLAQSLTANGIAYHHLKDLGGRRRPNPDSPNYGWRNDSFRGYADYMQTDPFHHALEKLIRIAETSRTAIMCAEAVPWRCHRSLVADALTVRHMDVFDIFSERKASQHQLTSFARVDDERITYPEPNTLL